jgi:hypothetical protein
MHMLLTETAWGCSKTFDTVDAADGSHPDILSCIDDKLRSAGCYG